MIIMSKYITCIANVAYVYSGKTLQMSSRMMLFVYCVGKHNTDTFWRILFGSDDSPIIILTLSPPVPNIFGFSLFY